MGWYSLPNRFEGRRCQAILDTYNNHVQQQQQRQRQQQQKQQVAEVAQQEQFPEEEQQAQTPTNPAAAPPSEVEVAAAVPLPQDDVFMEDGEITYPETPVWGTNMEERDMNFALNTCAYGVKG